ncbi:MAG TPA: c-type cytochrome [Vicinamibacterales bacterium]|nr:c-type cytochrome [Vicinamibacterales bacterium]
MLPRQGGLAVLLLGLLSAVGCNRTPDPSAAEAGADAAAVPALSPEEALRTFVLPPGYRMELVASEPQVADPVWIDFDASGRLWVVEMRGFMPDQQATGEREPVGRIVVLEDDDDDGRMDRSTVFLDGLVLPRSVKVLERGVLIVEPPHLWLAEDRDGDLRADARRALRDDFGLADGNPEHNANGLLWGMDNWIYTSEHDGHLRLRNGQWEHRRTVQAGQWGLSMDDVGRVYRNWNDDPLRVDLFPARYFMRNPNVVRARGIWERASGDTTVWPVRPNRGVNRGYRPGALHADGSLATFAAAGTPVVYRGDRLPGELYGSVFVTEPAGNLVRRFVVQADEHGIVRGRNPYERGEFIASTDERFRPVNLFSAPDGTLYVVDMYRGVIQHAQYQSEYLKDHIHRHGLERPIARGRIYRVVHETTRRDRKPDLSRRPSAALVEVLAHPNGWWRDTAQRLIVERGDRSVAAALRDLASGAPDHRTRLHALWTLDGLGVADDETILRALEDTSPHVRAAAVRLAEPSLSRGANPLRAAVLARVADQSPTVRRQVALSLGELPAAERLEVLTGMLDRYGSDAILVDAAISGLAGHELAVLQRLLAGRAKNGKDAARHDAIAMLAGAIVKSGDRTRIEALIGHLRGTSRQSIYREAIVAGFEAALVKRPPSAVPSRERSASLSLDRPPAALLELASGSSRGLARRAALVLAALDWPGKPAMRPPVTPLSEEQKRAFAEGEKVYGAVCAACHQPDGRGREGVAPPLVGSKWVLGSPGLAARIVLNGKEGSGATMPGIALTDGQAAAVLTYVRRAWGHGASPVGTDLIREVRGASTGRARPWTETELEGVTQPDGWPPPETRASPTEPNGAASHR